MSYQTPGGRVIKPSAIARYRDLIASALRGDGFDVIEVEAILAAEPLSVRESTKGGSIVLSRTDVGTSRR